MQTQTKYSADDIKELAREYLIDNPLTGTLMPELVLSSFTTWLKQREGQVTRTHTSYCRLPAHHLGHCSIRGRGDVLRFEKGVRDGSKGY